MKIRTHLTIILIAALMTLAWFTVASIVLVSTIQNKMAKREVSREIIKAVFDLNILRSDYQIYASERSFNQWQKRYISFQSSLDSGTRYFNTPEEKQYIASMRQRLQSMESLFAEVRKKPASEIELTLRGQLLQHSQESVAAASQLSRHMNEQMKFWINIALAITVIFLINAFILILWAYRLILTRVMAPIRKLEEGVHTISAGNLKYKIPIEHHDEIGYLSSAFNDMTANLQQSYQDLEKRVRERTKALEISNQELEQFAYVSSHDLQEPLRTISSYVDLFNLKYEKELNSEAKEYLGFVQESSLRALQLIRELLSYASIGMAGEAAKNVDMNEVLQKTLLNLKSSIESSGAQVTSDPLPVLPIHEIQVIQLLQNLISNAIKYRGPNSPRIHVSAQLQGDSWIFSIADNGIGMDPKYEAEIFKIFKRLHTRKEYPGTGIGLAISKKIVQYHGGEIWAKSEPGNGSTFYFSLRRPAYV